VLNYDLTEVKYPGYYIANPYTNYKQGADILTFFVAPATVVLAVPLYKNLNIIKKYFLPILLGCLVGISVGAIVGILLCNIFGISKEVLMSSFKNSYSAAKASLEEAHQRFQVSRKILERTFCQPIYEEFILELIKNGDIDCPRFFEDESVRYAFTRCIWVGAGKSSLDPLKDANANGKELENFTTSRSIIAATSGYDYEEIFRERAEEEKEIALLEKDLKAIRKGGEK